VHTVLARCCAAALVVVVTVAAGPRDVLSRARQLYNGAEYDGAIEAARRAAATPDVADAAQLVLARAALFQKPLRGPIYPTPFSFCFLAERAYPPKSRQTPSSRSQSKLRRLRRHHGYRH